MPAQRPGLRPLTATVLALAVRAAVLLFAVHLTTEGSLRHSFEQLRPGWIGVIAVAELITFPAYLLMYRGAARLDPPIRLPWKAATQIVLAGFGPLTLSGGFAADRRALLAIEGDEQRARRRVGAVSNLEWAVLAPLAAVAAIALLITGSPVSASITWPWALGIPAGIGVATWATAPGRPDRLAVPGHRWSGPLGRLLDGLSAVRTMVAHPRRYAGAWVGALGYWAAEIGAFYGAGRTVNVHLGARLATLAYANGYLASRRALPLGGAGVAEALLVYSLYELRVPLGPAIACVMLYRAFNFMLEIIPALAAQRSLGRSLAIGSSASAA